MKKSKVVKVTRLDKKDSYGNTTFVVELENGDKGYYVSKNENQTKFVAGSEAEYNIEEKEGKKGQKYFKITVPQQERSFQGGGRQQVDPRVQMISFAMAYTKDLVVAGKVDLKDLPIQFEIIYNEMIAKL